MKTLHDLTAEKLEAADPATREVLLRIPLENINRWLAHGHAAPHRLEQWRQILINAQNSSEGFQELLGLLRNRSGVHERLLEFAPFAGVLTAQERLIIIRQCAYSH